MFSKNRNTADGLGRRRCKACVSEESRRYREAHKEEINERKRISYHKSKGWADERTAKQAAAGTRVCTACGVEKPISEYYMRGNGGFYARCKQCEGEAMSRYRVQNRDAVIERKRAYHKAHKAEIDAHNHEYYREHTDEIKERVRKWVEENPDMARDNSVMGAQRALSRAKGLQTTLTKAEWKNAVEFFSENGQPTCAYCGKPLDRPTQDHVIPRSAGGAYSEGNIIPTCMSCNCRKATFEWITWYRTQPLYSREREERITEYIESFTD